MREDCRGGAVREEEWPPPRPYPFSHPIPQPSHSPFPALPPNPAWAPCHCESLPQKDEHQQEDEEAGGEQQLGWEKGREGAQTRWQRSLSTHPGPRHSHPRSSRSRCQCHRWHTGPSRCRKTGDSELREDGPRKKGQKWASVHH